MTSEDVSFISWGREEYFLVFSVRCWLVKTNILELKLPFLEDYPRYGLER